MMANRWRCIGRPPVLPNYQSGPWPRLSSGAQQGLQTTTTASKRAGFSIPCPICIGKLSQYGYFRICILGMMRVLAQLVGQSPISHGELVGWLPDQQRLASAETTTLKMKTHRRNDETI